MVTSTMASLRQAANATTSNVIRSIRSASSTRHLLLRSPSVTRSSVKHVPAPALTLTKKMPTTPHTTPRRRRLYFAALSMRPDLNSHFNGERIRRWLNQIPRRRPLEPVVPVLQLRAFRSQYRTRRSVPHSPITEGTSANPRTGATLL